MPRAAFLMAISCLIARLPSAGAIPAVNVLRSISRTMPACNNDKENEIVNLARRHLAAYENMAEMIRLGAYRKGTNKEVDDAMNFYGPLEEFLRQDKDESDDLAGRLCEAGTHIR